MARDTHPGDHTDYAALLERLCAEELSHVLCNEWAELEALAPFIDVCEPCAEAPYLVHRSYQWAGSPGGDILCQVSVYERPDGGGRVVSRDCVIRRN